MLVSEFQVAVRSAKLEFLRLIGKGAYLFDFPERGDISEIDSDCYADFTSEVDKREEKWTDILVISRKFPGSGDLRERILHEEQRVPPS